jgi:hypothetical protein
VAYGNEEPRRILTRMVADKEQFATRLTALLDSRRHTIDFGEFPMEFTSLHDVSLEYLLSQLIEHQRRDVQAIEAALGQLTSDVDGRALVEEVLASSRRHLHSLESLTRQPTAA